MFATARQVPVVKIVAAISTMDDYTCIFGLDYLDKLEAFLTAAVALTLITSKLEGLYESLKIDYGWAQVVKKEDELKFGFFD